MDAATIPPLNDRDHRRASRGVWARALLAIVPPYGVIVALGMSGAYPLSMTAVLTVVYFGVLLSMAARAARLVTGGDLVPASSGSLRRHR
jgi:hypothetical protein